MGVAVTPSWPAVAWLGIVTTWLGIFTYLPLGLIGIPLMLLGWFMMPPKRRRK